MSHNFGKLYFLIKNVKHNWFCYTWSWPQSLQKGGNQWTLLTWHLTYISNISLIALTAVSNWQKEVNFPPDSSESFTPKSAKTDLAVVPKTLSGNLNALQNRFEVLFSKESKKLLLSFTSPNLTLEKKQNFISECSADHCFWQCFKALCT